jgi:hypothetical protein
MEIMKQIESGMHLGPAWTMNKSCLLQSLCLRGDRHMMPQRRRPVAGEKTRSINLRSGFMHLPEQMPAVLRGGQGKLAGVTARKLAA